MVLDPGNPGFGLHPAHEPVIQRQAGIRHADPQQMAAGCLQEFDGLDAPVPFADRHRARFVADFHHQNLAVEEDRGLTESAHKELSGRHPELGVVTLRQLLATWVAHDLDHIVQVSRIIARQ